MLIKIICYLFLHFVANVTSSLSDAQWMQKLVGKLECIDVSGTAIYLYHSRKAAGTTVREILKMSAQKWKVPFYESEGITQNQQFLDLEGLLSFTSVRDPVSRVVSLYWYEHVAWFDQVLKSPDKIVPFDQWVAGWRDGSKWKEDYLRRHPKTVYVEIGKATELFVQGW